MSMTPQETTMGWLAKHQIKRVHNTHSSGPENKRIFMLKVMNSVVKYARKGVLRKG